LRLSAVVSAGPGLFVGEEVLEVFSSDRVGSGGHSAVCEEGKARSGYVTYLCR
jgi:hypothetical protein